ncbi:MAG: Stf0 family sulfotransferase [Hyphomicrobium sp.]
MVAQAVSLQIAQQTGNWDSEYSVGRAPVDNINTEAIRDHIMCIAEDNRRWEIFFSAFGLKPLRISYDEISDNVLEVAGQIRKRIGVPQEELFPQFRIKKQANELNELMRLRAMASFQEDGRM